MNVVTARGRARLGSLVCLNLARTRRGSWLALAAITAILLALPAGASAKGLGEWTQPDVNASIEKGVAYLVSQQNEDGSIGGSYRNAETAVAITSFGVLDQGNFANLAPADQTAVKKAVEYLLGEQASDGSWGSFAKSPGSLTTYGTGLALLGLSFSSDVPTTVPGAVAAAIAKGREFLIGEQQNKTPEEKPCKSTGGTESEMGYCGGWNYTPPSCCRSDQSNTGFAMTGLAASGGVPKEVAELNLGWQRNVQSFSGNPFGAGSRNDGGAGYEPFEASFAGDFSSNANDSGTNLFSFGFDGLPSSDPAVQASIAFNGDVLSSYELEKAHLLAEKQALSAMTMIFHTGNALETPCTPDEAACEWRTASGEGGFHYSMFSITKGFSQYQPADLGNPANYYAKVVDLLLSQQETSGEEAGGWPADPRDDPSPVMATGFAILALGRVGAPAQISGTVYNDSNGNGTRDAGEAGLGGWTVFVDANGSGNPAGQPQAVTAADGSYSIQNLPEGNFPVRVVGQSGYTCTQPSGGCTYSEHFTFDVNLTGLDFGESKPTPVTQVLAAKTTAPAKGTASIASIRGCIARTSYLASVHGTSIASVTFKVDGHTIKVLHKPTGKNTYAARVAVRSGSTHHVTIKVVFTSSSKTATKTLHQTVARCAVRRSLPRFTG